MTSTVAWLLLFAALVAAVVVLRRLEPYLPSRRARRFVQRRAIPPVELLTAVSVTIRLPWRTVVRDPVRLGEGASASRSHRFTITLPRSRPIERLLEEIPAAALLSPWASTTRLPEVRLQSETDQGYVLEVTAHALDARFAPQIEADIRERLA